MLFSSYFLEEDQTIKQLRKIMKAKDLNILELQKYRISGYSVIFFFPQLFLGYSLVER